MRCHYLTRENNTRGRSIREKLQLSTVLLEVDEDNLLEFYSTFGCHLWKVAGNVLVSQQGAFSHQFRVFYKKNPFHKEHHINSPQGAPKGNEHFYFCCKKGNLLTRTLKEGHNVDIWQMIWCYRHVEKYSTSALYFSTLLFWRFCLNKRVSHT